ncbi:pyridoxal phosphate-dependent aminotransferase [Skermanella stibiiresistens]|uniref:pyridoxal phosphate-dependent aminotransferase n=1 Tax=Skermanella stibiiresistens TaxID=913326 RepID=UPI0004B5E8ED|nr:aminotransferase class I/II-fold pyridoxal phosphate-dependent enzyme [Skermanella stibiiresistens]
MRFSPLVDRISGKGSDAWSIHWRARELVRQGRDVIMLTVGDPDLPPPAIVIDAAVASLRAGETTYSPIAGHPDVRAAIAARHQARTGTPTEADDVVVVPGAQAGLYCAMRCLAGPGDEVIVPEPMYATYEAVAGAAGATVVNVALRPERGFHLDLDDLERVVTPRTRVLWLNSPHNPTGAVMTRAEVEATADFCRRHDLWLLSDEVYADLAYAGPHVSPRSLPGMAERTVVVSSLSKSHAVPGFRFGWIVGPPELAKHLTRLVLCMLYGGPPFIQAGALAALTNECPEVTAMAAAYQRRADIMVSLLESVPGLRASRPEGGMFVLLDVRGTGQASDEFAQGLLERHGVAVLPSDGFGPSAVGHLRISLAASDRLIEEAAKRIAAHARSA